MTTESNSNEPRRTSSAGRRAMTGGVARAYYKREGIVFQEPDAAKGPQGVKREERIVPAEAAEAESEASATAAEAEVESEIGGEAEPATPAAEDGVEVETADAEPPEAEVGTEPEVGTAEAAPEPSEPDEPEAIVEPEAEREPETPVAAEPEPEPADTAPEPAAQPEVIVVEPVPSVHIERPVSPQEAAAAARRSSHAFVEVPAAPTGNLGASLLNPIWAATAQKLTRQAAEKEGGSPAPADASPSDRRQDDEDEVLHLEAQPVAEEPDGAFEVLAKKIASLLNNRRAESAPEEARDHAPASPDEEPSPERLPGDEDDGREGVELPGGEKADARALGDGGDAAEDAQALPSAGEATAAALPAGPPEEEPLEDDEAPAPGVEAAPAMPALATGTWRDNAFGRFVNRLIAALCAAFAHLGAFIVARWRHFRENPGPLRTTVRNWFSRVAGAAHEGSFSSQPEEYASGRTSRDFVCNMLGIASFGALFPLLTVVVTQIMGAELAGMFSLSFVAGSLFLIIANYGMRPYQVSDINEEHSFADYRVHRFCTCLLMALVGLAYCWLRGYSGTMLSISLGVYGYKLIEGMADAYEGRLQQKDKLYLAGISQTIRSVGAFIVFTIVLLISHNLAAACISLPITGLITFFGFTFPLAKLETPKSRPFKVERVVDLFKQCTPLFISLFLYTLIDYMPVFVMEGVLSYDNQLYYNAMYFPAQAIAVGLSVVYKPQLLRIANLWNDKARRRYFDMITIAIFALIALVTALVTLIMSWIGVPIMSFLYGLDFEQFRGLMIIFLIAGGVTSFIDFLYQITAVLRRQQKIMQNYLITFGFSLFVPTLLVNFTGLPGAVIGYLIVMCILLVLTGTEYVRIRMDIAQEEADEAAQVAQHQQQQRKRWTSRFRTNK